MARITVEDCLPKVPNPFELIMLATQRARSIAAGAALTIERDNDKNAVVALREIADGTVRARSLEEEMINGMRKPSEIEETAPPAEDKMDIPALQGLLPESERLAAALLRDADESAPEMAASAPGDASGETAKASELVEGS